MHYNNHSHHPPLRDMPLSLTESQIPKFRTQNQKRLAFVYPPYGAIDNEPGLKVVKENYGLFPSLSLLYVAGSAQGAGHECRFFDVNATQNSMQEVSTKIKAFNPDYILYTITTYQFKENLEFAKSLKEILKIPVLIGGVHTEIYPQETMSHEVFDVAFLSEIEISLPLFLECDVLDLDAYAKVPGILFRKDTNLIRTPNAPILSNVDLAHFPARNLIDNSLYYSFLTKYKNFTPFISSRGCPFHCIFCEQGDLKFRGRSAQNVWDEIFECHEKYQIREFDFFDSSFTINKKRVIEICQKIIDSGLKIHWSVRSRVDCVNEEVLHWLARANCTRIYYGVESANACILKTLRKDTNLDRIEKTIALTRKLGIHTFGYFMIGSPGETRETITQTIDFAKKLDLDYAQFSKVTPMPATELYSMFLKEFQTDFWREYVKNPSKQIFLPRPGCHLSEEEIQAACQEAYRQFYFRPSYIFKALLQVRSAKELKRSIKVAIEMLFSR